MLLAMISRTRTLSSFTLLTRLSIFASSMKSIQCFDNFFSMVWQAFQPVPFSRTGFPACSLFWFKVGRAFQPVTYCFEIQEDDGLESPPYSRQIRRAGKPALL
jgi:hypothetical protein